MTKANFRFYGELNDFLPPPYRQHNFQVSHQQRGTIKDMIECLGVPHTRVDLIIINGQSVDFDYIVQAGDRISVYPLFRSIDISPLKRLINKK